MKRKTTAIEGLLVFEPVVYKDKRGFFFESFRASEFGEAGILRTFVQDNQSQSQYGVIRGLHYQRPPHAQAKLVRVLDGLIYDVAVDLRPDSRSYGKWYGIELSSENLKQLYIPAGFAHGFSVLSDRASVMYKCDAYYHPDAEAGIRYNDPSLNIDWRLDSRNMIVSDKDLSLPLLKDL
ncbi:MAG: dTDP-4-dehydrorhamnose 3,5-epimerase [Bacteroidetes bacterium]|nr:MAG: dTDP-4-dehydrorhamnose 3,5-epimerase [Bacteroidota bacterium]